MILAGSAALAKKMVTWKWYYADTPRAQWWSEPCWNREYLDYMKIGAGEYW